MHYCYAVLCLYKNGVNVFYTYPEQTSQTSSTKIYPNNYQITSAKSIYDINNGAYAPYKELSGTPNDYNLHIPEEYKHDDIKISIEKDEDLSDDIFNKIKNVNKEFPFVIVGEDFSKRKIISQSYYNIRGGNRVEELYCTKCNKIFYPDSLYRCICPDCKDYNDVIAMKDFKDFRKKNYDSKKSDDSIFYRFPTSIKSRFYFLTNHPEDANGIIIYKICKEISAVKNSIITKFNIEYSIEHIVGKRTVTYKHLKKSKKECDAFEALNINTKNITSVPTIIYDNCKDFWDFASKNEKFLRMSGFQTVLKYSSMNLKLEPFFIVFIGIMNKYPVMEQIVKMGHAKLFFNLYKEMLQSLNKDEINRIVDNLSQLVDNESKKGKDALRFPTYIGDYLIKKDAKLDEYYYWRDLYEITKITKEQFENLTDSFNYAWINSQVGMSDIGNILKFGYTVDKLFNYIIKQSKTNNYTIQNTITYLSDYLNMCDMVQVESDKFPQDVKKVHDDMLSYYRNREQIEYDKKLTVIGSECEDYVIPSEEELDHIGIPKLFTSMTVVFPKSETDFINEGNQQHNCVGSYPNKVRNGNCVIFFIRHKDNPSKSFITAECTRSGLGQCFYSNNRYVYDEDLIKFAKYIANKIKAGCSSGKIHALNNIKG